MIQSLDHLFADIARLKVGVIGDVMLDTYWWGNVERISPEAPVPVVALSRKETRIGGAGNVALNIVSLGASCAILSVVGKDIEGKQLKSLLSEQKIDVEYLLERSTRTTTNKIRIISRNQQMLRLDAEQSLDLDNADEKLLLAQITDFIEKEKPDIIILEDYNKGILTEKVITGTISLCNKKNIKTTVDPKRKNFFAYQNATLFKPNLHEVLTSLNLLPEVIDENFLSRVHKLLAGKLDHKISLITLSEKGIFYHDTTQGKIIPSHRRSIADVSGAGDTVIAVASLVYAVSGDIRLSAEISNIAGGIVCEEVGTVAISREKLLEETKSLLPASN